MISDFFSAGVDGTQLWAVDPAGGVARSGSYEFLGHHSEPKLGIDLLDYAFVSTDGARTPMMAVLVTDPLAPDGAEVRLWYPNAPTGWYQLSDFNSSGESALSADQVWLD